MKRILILATLAFCTFASNAETPAEILRDVRVVTVTSQTDAKYHIVQRIRVNSPAGDEVSVFGEYTDTYRSISDFSGTVECAGKVLKKLKKSDLATFSYSESLADDTYLNAYAPVASYPYEVEYDYTLTFRKGIISYPTFKPVAAFDIPVKEASYTLSVPLDIAIRYKSWTEPEVKREGKRIEYIWKLSDFSAIRAEHNMPDPNRYLPYVYASPESFRYLGTSGSQNSWEDIGRWLYGIMPADGTLPDELAAKVHELTDGCKTDLDKLRTLYAFLRENTRYVSIQFGIGGFSPAPPSAVYKTGWGDCKALSYYLKALLAEAGVGSDYYIINTDKADLIDGYPSAGIMNHAMLCVPLQNDTVWVECTNPRFPLGYRHSRAAGHKIVLIDEDGGHPLRVPAYPDSLRVNSDVAYVHLNGDGSAQVKVELTRHLEDAEPFIDFRTLGNKDAVGILSRDIAVQNDDKKVLAVRDNFDEYSGKPGFCPEVNVQWAFFSRKFASSAADRLLVPVTLYKSALSSQKSARTSDLEFTNGFTDINVLSIELPEGYSVEYLPEDTAFATTFADYSIRYSNDGTTITITEEMTAKKCIVPASDYPAYKQFASTHNKALEAKIVLARNR